MGKSVQNQASEAKMFAEGLFPDEERVIRLGVTGLSRAGKTVFITSLIANLKNSENMVELNAAHEGRIKAAELSPDGGGTIIPSFPFEDHLHAMVGGETQASWPPGTENLSGLRLSLRVKKKMGLFSLGKTEKTIHLDIIDFPGEWLIDLTMMDKSFASWSIEYLKRLAFAAVNSQEEASRYIKQLQEINDGAKFNQEDAQSLARIFTAYLKALKGRGYSTCTPGRFLQPGDEKSSPVLTFAPLYQRNKADEGSLYKVFEGRFEEYKKRSFDRSLRIISAK